MELTPLQVTRPRYVTSERYFLLEADGRTGLGYIQRPGSIQKAKRSGMGLWDEHEGEIIVQPDVQKRIEKIRENAEYHQRLAQQHFQRIQQIEAFHAVDAPESLGGVSHE